MLTLVKFGIGPKAKIANYSPFCLKLETYLRAAKIEFKEEILKGDPNKCAPKGKLPFIRHKGLTLGDSAIIIKYLKKQFSADLDLGLSDRDAAISNAFCAMIEEHAVQCLVYLRWQDDLGWSGIKEAFFGFLPFPLKLIVPNIVRKKTIHALWCSGMGRHSRDEVIDMLRADFTALNQILGDKDFFFDSQIRTLDTSAYGLLANCACDINPQVQEIMADFPQLLAFTERVTKSLYHH